MQIPDLKSREKDGGFTFVEIIAVIAIIGILVSLALPKFINFEGDAKQKILYSALSELNAREELIWSKIKLSNRGWVDDDSLFSKLDTNFGADFKWAPKANTTGGNLHYRGENLKLNRIPSTTISPGQWSTK